MNILDKIIEAMKPLNPKDFEKQIIRLRKARFRLLLEYRFYAQIAHKFNFIPSRRIATTAVDAKANFWFNPEWIDKLPDEDLKFEVGHEAGHIVFRHIARTPASFLADPAKKHKLNLAQDIAIDISLVAKLPNRSLPSKTAISDEWIKKYAGWTSEQIYNDLKDPPSQNNPCPVCAGGGENGQSGENEGQGKGGQSGEDEEQGKGGQAKGDKDCNHHKPGPGGRDCCLPDFEQMTEQQQLEWTQYVIQTALATEQSMGQGHLPGPVVDFMQQLTKPQIKWQNVLRNLITSSKASKETYLRPSRRSAAVGVRLPAIVKTPAPDVAVFLDTSGSISHDFARMGITECYSILQSFNMRELRFLMHHVECYFDETMKLEAFINKKLTYQSGGTSHLPVFEKCLSSGHRPKIIVSFTDLMSSFPPNPGIPVIWVVEKGPYNYAQYAPNYGKIVYVSLKEGVGY